ncbi:7474_t:CDS:2, partial [Acaulospora morrowiae]
GNGKLDQYLKRKRLENEDNPIYLKVDWIPFDQFEGLDLLRRGGEGLIYVANWKNGPLNLGPEKVALKCLHGSTSDIDKFIKELDIQVSLYHTNTPLCYGVSQLPTKQYIIVMEYAEDGDLQRYIRTNFRSIKWKEKLEMMFDISKTLQIIHKAQLVHGDLHSGNILRKNDRFYISDLGLCRPYTETNDCSNLIGVLPYIAPEVLLGKPHGYEADIYGFGVIMWEITSGKQPYGTLSHDVYLAQEIINGERPSIGSNVPSDITNLIRECWSGEPKKRPNADDIHAIFNKWLFEDLMYEKWPEPNVDYEHPPLENNVISTKCIPTNDLDYISIQANYIIPDDLEYEDSVEIRIERY